VTLVVLAAGRGNRFGAAKQLEPVGPGGQTIPDVLLARAGAAGFERAVVVVSPAVHAGMDAHFATHSPAIPVALVTQLEARGTADAVLAARAEVGDAFVVVNADDVYPQSAFTLLAKYGRDTDEHATVAFRAGNTVFGPKPVARALLETDDAHSLLTITEGHLTLEEDQLRFEQQPLRGDELVSMNIWLFRRSIFEYIETVVAHTETGEAYLPDAVGVAVACGETVRVLSTEERCVELTYRGDLATVREAMA
jgi:bifunctional N-acetylglucosamine-1-phosphate-uridyltransferase/glucosamine-1-phosphate-acetyltransferase GlmU-like protein